MISNVLHFTVWLFIRVYFTHVLFTQKKKKKKKSNWLLTVLSINLDSKLGDGAILSRLLKCLPSQNMCREFFIANSGGKLRVRKRKPFYSGGGTRQVMENLVKKGKRQKKGDTDVDIRAHT